MARTNLAVQSVKNHDFLDVVFTPIDAANGMEFNNDQRTVLIVKTGTLPTGVVTIAGVTDSNRRTGDIVFTPAADKIHFVNKFPFELFGQAGGKVFLDTDVATDIEVAAVIEAQ